MSDKKQSTTAKAKEALLRKDPPKRKLDRRDYLSVGTTTGNLACTGKNPFGAIKPGTGVLLVGPSSSGKTGLANTMAAEAAINKRFDNYQIIVDDPENGNGFNISSMYSAYIADRVKAPKYDKHDEPVYSSTVDDFFGWLIPRMEKGPVIAFLDSMDALMQAGEKIVYRKNIDKREKGQKEQDTYGAAKAKSNYAGYRYALSLMEKTGSIVVIIAHSKDIIGQMSYGGPKKGHTGGAALKYFASMEIWTVVLKTLTKPFREKKLPVGIQIGLSIKKNRNSGLLRQSEFPFYAATGADNTGCSVEYLLEYGFWRKVKGNVKAKEFKVEKRMEELIQWIDEKKERRIKLRKIITEAWKEQEEAVRVVRYNKYQNGE